MAAPGTNRRRSRALHRWLGIILLLPILVASITGIILNHTVDLGLSKRHVTSHWVQKQYGMALEGEPLAYGLDGKAYAAAWDGQVFFRKNPVDTQSPLVGAVPLRDGIAIVTEDAVHYFGLDGELIETLTSPTLPDGEISRTGRTKDLTLALDIDGKISISDRELLAFSEAAEGQGIEWSVQVTPTASDRETWKSAHAGDGIPLDRLILDIHSGRFFGPIGKWAYDIMVIGVLFLSATGLILFFRTRRRNP